MAQVTITLAGDPTRGVHALRMTLDAAQTLRCMVAKLAESGWPDAARAAASQPPPQVLLGAGGDDDLEYQAPLTESIADACAPGLSRRGRLVYADRTAFAMSIAPKAGAAPAAPPPPAAPAAAAAAPPPPSAAASPMEVEPLDSTDDEAALGEPAAAPADAEAAPPPPPPPGLAAPPEPPAPAATLITVTVMSIHGIEHGQRAVRSDTKARDLLAALLPAPQEADAAATPGRCYLVAKPDGTVLPHSEWGRRRRCRRGCPSPVGSTPRPRAPRTHAPCARHVPPRARSRPACCLRAPPAPLVRAPPSRRH